MNKILQKIGTITVNLSIKYFEPKPINNPKYNDITVDINKVGLKLQGPSKI